MLHACGKVMDMRIAVPYNDGQVYDHYGSAEAFKIYDTQDGKIVSGEVVPTAGRGHFYMVQFLINHEVKEVLCQSMGKPAQATLEIAGIGFTTGASGDADAAVEAYLQTQR